LLDAVCAIIYAAPHTELKGSFRPTQLQQARPKDADAFRMIELHLAREMLMQKFGRTFALSVINNDPPCVPTRVLSKLAIYVPPPDLVDMCLQEIAKGYGINWTSDRIKQDEPEVDAVEPKAADEAVVDGADDGGVKVSLKLTITLIPLTRTDSSVIIIRQQYRLRSNWIRRQELPQI
jgi:hypothetical protein